MKTLNYIGIAIGVGLIYVLYKSATDKKPTGDVKQNFTGGIPTPSPTNLIVTPRVAHSLSPRPRFMNAGGPPMGGHHGGGGHGGGGNWRTPYIIGLPYYNYPYYQQPDVCYTKTKTGKLLAHYCNDII